MNDMNFAWGRGWGGDQEQKLLEENFYFSVQWLSMSELLIVHTKVDLVRLLTCILAISGRLVFFSLGWGMGLGHWFPVQLKAFHIDLNKNNVSLSSKTEVRSHS